MTTWAPFALQPHEARAATAAAYSFIGIYIFGVHGCFRPILNSANSLSVTWNHEISIGGIGADTKVWTKLCRLNPRCTLMLQTVCCCTHLYYAHDLV